MNKRFQIGCSLFFFSLLMAGVWLFYPTEHARKALDEMRLLVQQGGAAPVGAQQSRRGVRKDFIISSPEKRLHTRVSADTSLVDFEKDDDDHHLIESLSNVTYVTQEALRPQQQLRVIEAETAVYHHKNQQITADRVTFFRASAETGPLPESVEGLRPTMAGEADHLTLDLEGEHRYHVDHFRGHLFTPGRNHVDKAN